ncbi:DUF4199 domain-containing protein [Haliscomenobacter hydrossis]|uniref:DUF4199 domain-containing protein n=1 Tax=Haliscomenobacter hydrossis (strain ATCC 27775 / DSM 1100 / LMG 10767 / O) TaxID=760192 RepID=F4KXB0_HALH1|nr:DUF4199 domain-containing protein [Haliscomenobacter hydrossis]AEE49318.1 hypothetical protein Halhy_1424 [Haliscomenobacter hydrossis DSM 1100]
MQKHALIFGSLAGGILILLFILEQPLLYQDGKFDFKKGEILGYISMLVSLSMIFFGIRSFRDQHLNGSITFGKAFQVGLMITLVASVIYVVGWMIYYNTSESMQKFPELYLNHMLEELKKSGKSAAEIVKQEAEFRKNMEMYKNPLIMMAITFLEIFPVGLVVDVISALLLKKKPTESSAG